MGSKDLHVDDEAISQIQDQVLKAEKKQLHLRQPHGIIPEIKEIIEEEITEADDNTI
jgi:hypothetical protein